MSKPDIEAFIEQATLHHLTIEFTADEKFLGDKNMPVSTV